MLFQKGLMIFGSLAILVTFVTVDPLALRPHLSASLLFSDDSYIRIIGLTFLFVLNNCVILHYRLVNQYPAHALG